MDAYIIHAYRTAIGKADKGGFKHMRSDDLAVAVINKLMAEADGLEADHVDDVIVGCANPEGEQGLQMGRIISGRALGKQTPGMTVNRYCGSGLEAIAIATAKIRGGMGECYIAGGAESMSLVPMTGYKLAPNYEMIKETPNYFTSMGHTAEAVAEKYDVSREEQDEWALRSHQRAARAIDEGLFEREIVPVEVTEVYVEDDQRQEKSFIVDTDEGVRRDTSLEALASLRPSFTIGGSVTAGNSSQRSDGASFAIVISEKLMKDLGLEPKARLVACSVAGVDPLYMGIGPCVAMPLALRQAGLKQNEIGLVELNEAFAAQSLAVIKNTELDPEIVNVNGGAIALGHPLGCTGAKLSTQLINEMHRRDERYGMVTACIGGGQGIAGIFERLN